MRTLLRRFFVENWQRKLFSLVLAMIVWMVVNHSMSTTKVIHNIPIRVKNTSQGKTIEGLQSSGFLNQKVSLSFTGNKNSIDELSNDDFEVVIDAAGKEGEWIATVTKKNLICLNPNIDLGAISSVQPHDFILKTTKLATEKVPILVTKPIGEAPKGYQFLDVWPYKLYLTLSGPEEILKKLKNRGVKLTFNLGEISKDELDLLYKSNPAESDEISYIVPDLWKKISIPHLSDISYSIDDPQSKFLRIDFVKRDLIPIGLPIPITVFYPTSTIDKVNPTTFHIQSNSFIEDNHGVKVINKPLYAKGVSRLFVDIVKQMMQIVIVASPKKRSDQLLWNTQIIYPHDLENIYVDKIMAENAGAMNGDLLPRMREEYLRNRFRAYMNLFRLYTKDDEKLSLAIKLRHNEIAVLPQNSSFVQ